MTTAYLLENIPVRQLDNNGDPVAGAFLHTWIAGTTTNLATYTDATGSVPLSNPIVADSEGFFPQIWLADAAYDLEARFPDDTTVLWPALNVTASGAQATNAVANFITSLASSIGASLVGFIQAGIGAILRTMQDKAREIVSVGDFGAIGDGSLTSTQMLAALTVAWTNALTTKRDLYFPPGTYDCGNNNFPFRNTVDTSLLDCGGMTIWCAGLTTILQTTSNAGADVLQLNALKNFSVRGFPTITASLTATTGSGSNGVSITNGWDNLYLEIYALNLPGIDKTTFIDGGKALTLQNGTTANACGTLKGIVRASGCVEGFGFEPDLVTSAAKSTSVDIDLQARNCWAGFKFVAAAATAALSPSMSSGVRVRGEVTDCQHGAVIQRAHGVLADLTINSTLTAAAKRLSPLGVAWIASDSIVEGIQVDYAKNAVIRMAGNVGSCDYKARIGGTGSGSSGLLGNTSDSEIHIDLGGTAATADLLSLNSGGNSMAGCRLKLSAVTSSATIPSDWTAVGNGNVIQRNGNYTGSYAATLTGVSSGGTGTASYSIEGDQVTLQLPAITGTSNATTAMITGMPTEIQPTSTQGLVAITTDNGTNLFSRVNVNASGNIDLFYGPTTGTFTATGTKGIQLCTLTYRRS